MHSAARACTRPRDADPHRLISDYQSTRADHGRVREALRQLVLGGWDVCICPQNIYEFWVHATRPSDAAPPGLGLEPDRASLEIDHLLGIYTLLPEPPDMLTRWRAFCTAHEVRGKRAHDARIAALMLATGVVSILTGNAADFRGWEVLQVLSVEDV